MFPTTVVVVFGLTLGCFVVLLFFVHFPQALASVRSPEAEKKVVETKVEAKPEPAPAIEAHEVSTTVCVCVCGLWLSFAPRLFGCPLSVYYYCAVLSRITRTSLLRRWRAKPQVTCCCTTAAVCCVAQFVNGQLVRKIVIYCRVYALRFCYAALCRYAVGVQSALLLYCKLTENEESDLKGAFVPLHVGPM